MKSKSQAISEKIIGVDLHPDSFSLAVTVSEADDSLQILQQITQAPTSSWRDHLSKLPKPAVIVCEAGSNSFELMKVAEELGFQTCILNSIDVGQIGKKLCKTDKLDAVRIARIYRANLASKVWRPDEKTRDLREIGSMYTQVTRDRTRAINRIKSFLTQHNVRLGSSKDLLKPKTRAMIQNQRDWTESDLFLLEKYYCELENHTRIKQELYQFMLKTLYTNRSMRELMELCGIRVVAAFQVVAAIGDIKRFDTPKKLAAYFGVAPCIHQSGCREYSTGMQRDGRGQIRTLLVECSRSILRSKTAGAKHLREWGIKLKMRKGHNVAACGLARKIATAVWYALNGFLPDIADNETAVRRKLATVFTEVRQTIVQTLGYKTRKEFIDDFSFAILTQQCRR